VRLGALRLRSEWSVNGVVVRRRVSVGFFFSKMKKKTKKRRKTNLGNLKGCMALMRVLYKNVGLFRYIPK